MTRKFPAESPDHDFTQGDKIDAQPLGGAGGRLLQGRIFQEEEGARIWDGQDWRYRMMKY